MKFHFLEAVVVGIRLVRYLPHINFKIRCGPSFTPAQIRTVDHHVSFRSHAQEICSYVSSATRRREHVLPVHGGHNDIDMGLRAWIVEGRVILHLSILQISLLLSCLYRF